MFASDQLRTLSDDISHNNQRRENPGFIDDSNFAEVDLNDGVASSSATPMSRYIANVAAR